jgi:four helix bundle protein
VGAYWDGSQLSIHQNKNVMKDYRKLVVWEKAHFLVLFIYRITKTFPREEQYGLINQIRRAATSAPTNIAEGCGRYTQLDFAKYLQQAFGSIQEVQYLSFLSFELKYLDQNVYDTLDKDINEVKAMLISLIQKVRSKQPTQ